MKSLQSFLLHTAPEAVFMLGFLYSTYATSHIHFLISIHADETYCLSSCFRSCHIDRDHITSYERWKMLQSVFTTDVINDDSFSISFLPNSSRVQALKFHQSIDSSAAVFFW